MPMSWQSDVEPRPGLLVLPPDAADLGEADAAIELWEHYSGKTLDPDQRLAVQVMMAIAADGRWAAATTGREKPRQNGKGDEVEVVELWGLVQRSEAILHTVHDAVLLATQTQQRMLSVLEGHADLRKRIKRKWQGTGQQMIEMRNGGVIWYRTRTGGGGRGVDDIDRLVVDEAQHATEEQLAAVSPTLLANANPQLNAMGTAGLANLSRWWWGIRRRALTADPGRFGYVGHTAEQVCLDEAGQIVQPPVDVSDRTLWLATNPAVAAGRGGGMAFLEEQFRNLSPESFAREHLGVWDPPPVEVTEELWSVWPKSTWMACRSKIPADQPGWLEGAVTLAVEVAPDFSSATIAVAGDSVEGKPGFGVVAHSPGTSWVFPELARLLDGDRPIAQVVRDPKGPAAAVLDGRCAAIGIELADCQVGDLAMATGELSTMLANGEVLHREAPEVDEAVSRASRRSWGSGGLWLLDRRVGDLTPIVAPIMALWGHRQTAGSVVDSCW